MVPERRPQRAPPRAALSSVADPIFEKGEPKPLEERIFCSFYFERVVKSRKVQADSTRGLSGCGCCRSRFLRPVMGWAAWPSPQFGLEPFGGWDLKSSPKRTGGRSSFPSNFIFKGRAFCEEVPQGKQLLSPGSSTPSPAASEFEEDKFALLSAAADASCKCGAVCVSPVLLAIICKAAQCHWA